MGKAQRLIGPDAFTVPCALEISIDAKAGTLAMSVVGGVDAGVDAGVDGRMDLGVLVVVVFNDTAKLDLHTNLSYKLFSY